MPRTCPTVCRPSTSARRTSAIAASVVASALLLGAAASQGATIPTEPVDEPVGVWNCLVYGHARRGDEQYLFRFLPDGRADVSPPRRDGFRIWSRLSDWRERRGRLSFSDTRLGREYEADLRRMTLGGRWTSPSGGGGWWCVQLSDTVEDDINVERTQTYDLMPPLLANRMATPNYPIRAIREAREGRAVVCFLVDNSGSIFDPHIVELTDEIFRTTTLWAIDRSHYIGWDKQDIVRPGCRSFIYELDPIF